MSALRIVGRRITPGALLALLALFVSLVPGVSAAEPARAAAQPTPKPARTARSVEVTALYYTSLADGTAGGGTSQVRITVEDSPSKEFRVGCFEGEVGGNGPMWRNAAWLASVVAAGFVDVDLANTRISFDVGGFIDGPSAGGLMTVGLVAALRGDTVRADAAMTGTINPDGSIGAVGGVPHKIQGAAKAGKKLVLIPAGERVQRDENQKKDVDLIEHGKAHGVEVREVADLYVAYELLTGKELPPLARNAAPEITDTKAYDRVRTKTAEWLARYQKAEAEYANLPDADKGEDIATMAADAKKAADLSERLLKQGIAGGALAKAREATFAVSSAREGARIVGIYKKHKDEAKGREAALAHLKARIRVLDKEAGALETDRLGKVQPKTLGEAGALLSAWAAYIDSIGYAAFADGLIEQKAENEEQAATRIGMAAAFLNYSALLQIAAADHLDIGMGLGGLPLPEKAPVERVASFYRHVAKANLDLLDVVLLDPEAKAAKKRLETVQEILMALDPSYAVASTAVELAYNLSRIPEGGVGASYASLGAALTGYSTSASVVAKFTSLGCELDDHFQPKAIGNERNLVNMLDLADTQARQSIAYLRQRKVDATTLIITYESARLRREGGIEEKLGALQDFWQIHVQARAMAYLGGLTGTDAGGKPSP